MKQLAKVYKRIVLKLGSSLFCSQKEARESYFRHIAEQVNCLYSQGREIIIVSSGAIALGMDLMNLKSRPGDLPSLQAAAALGQNILMDNYSRAFKDAGLKCAQILLTWDDFSDRRRYLNAKNTLNRLLKLGSIPIINENDTISTEEIKFGDNDRLSALVAALVNADILIMLSDVDGLLDKNKELIKVVSEINQEIRQLAVPGRKKTSVGGMITKIEAAKMAVDSGIPCVIANGRDKNIVNSIINNPAALGRWTVFLPKKGFLAARERWLAFGTKPKGKVIVDDGAKEALLNKKSLLSVGVTASEGNFDAGDIVSVRDKQNCEFARGKTRLADRELEKVKGRRSDKEVIHRDNIVIF